MANIGRIAASGLSSIVEATQTLVNLNFDFTLLRVEPPAEFRALGNYLALSHKETAEDGQLHVTAHRIAALFRPILPKTPNLIKAYGTRASEVAEKSSQDPPKGILESAFREHAGIDAGSIWAGATSSPESLQVHLLACMLARMWDGPEAISIWVELLDCRRRQIRTEYEDAGTANLSLLMHLGQSLDRQHLAEWDASARAWLSVADRIKAPKDKQLRLIVDNLCQPVNTKFSAYDSVMQAWLSGLKDMEQLVQGVSLSMRSGELLLAISAWHLYPDLNILDDVTKLVRMRDTLIPGILTVGLQRGEGQSHKGLYWSLPLAHLRYYGGATTRESNITATDRSRLSLDEFNVAVLGCLIGTWDVQEANLLDTVRWISRLARTVTGTRKWKTEVATCETYLDVFGRSADTFLNPDNDEHRRYLRKLLNLGRRNPRFLGTTSLPFFGLADVDTAMLLAQQELRIKILRAQAEKLGLSNPDDAIICYKPWDKPSPRDISTLLNGNGKMKGNSVAPLTEIKPDEFATALPRPRNSTKRTYLGEPLANGAHVRWVPSEPELSLHAWAPESRGTARTLEHTNDISRTNDSVFQPEEKDARWENAMTHFHRQAARYRHLGEDVRAAEIEPIRRLDRYTVIWSDPYRLPSGIDASVAGYDTKDDTEIYRHQIGNPDIAALFVRGARFGQRRLERSMISVSELLELLNEDESTVNGITDHISETLRAASDTCSRSLQAFVALNTLYCEWTSATISVRVFEGCLANTKWAANMASRLKEDQPYDADKKETFNLEDFVHDGHMIFQRSSGELQSSCGSSRSPSPLPYAGDPPSAPQPLSPKTMDESECFSCVLFCENAQDIHPGQLRHAMAISCGSTLFIAAALLQDPVTSPGNPKVWPVIGNVGRPGIAILTAPVEPQIKELHINSWNVLNFDQWDGVARNSFDKSTLHIGFTEAMQELHVGFSGSRDRELYFLETVMSLHAAKGQWVADLDTSKILLEASSVIRYHVDAESSASETATPPLYSTSAAGQTDDRPHCSPGTKAVCPENRYQSYSEAECTLALATIESWEEFLDSSFPDSCIFLAHGNWQARLAAVIISEVKNRPAIVLEESVCWHCVRRQAEKKFGRKPVLYIF